MTAKEIKDLLKSYRDLIEYQEYAREQIAEIEREKLLYMSRFCGAQDGMPRAPGVTDTVGRKVADAIARYDDDIKLYRVGLAQNEQKIRYIRHLLSMLPHRGELILRLRFCSGKTWEDTARKSHYSLSWTKKLADYYICVLSQKTGG